MSEQRPAQAARTNGKVYGRLTAAEGARVIASPSARKSFVVDRTTLLGSASRVGKNRSSK